MIKTTVVGSYPLPDWLVQSPSEQALRDATATVFHTQELAGIDLLVDGELYRFDINHPETNGMIEYFIRPLENVNTGITRTHLRQFREKAGMGFRVKPAGAVEGNIAEGELNIVADYQRTRSLTRGALKFTLTSPYMLAKTLLDNHYGSIEELTFAIAAVLADQVAEIDADVIQLDEANLTGHPEDAEFVAEALNMILDRVQNTPCIHLCFGNYGGQSIQKGTWDKLIDFLNALNIDHVVAEMAFRGFDELKYFNDLKPGIGLGLGIVDVKKTSVESADEIAEKLEQASAILGSERISYIHPDCGFWMLKRSIADAKMRSLVMGRNLFEGRT